MQILNFKRARRATLDAGTPDDAAFNIRELKRLIGPDRIAEASERYKAETIIYNGVHAIRMRERQYLIEGFKAFAKFTWNDRRPLTKLTPDIEKLVHVASAARTLAPTFGDEVLNQHRSSLLCLNGQLPPLFLEWRTAVQLVRKHSVGLCWIPSGQRSAPEFIAKDPASGIEFEVECKRQSVMTTQILGDAEADNLATSIMFAIQSYGLYGDVTLQVPREATQVDDAMIADVIQTLQTGLKVGNIGIDLPHGLRLGGHLSTLERAPITTASWHAYIKNLQAMHPNARSYATGYEEGGYVGRTLGLIVVAPPKSPAELRKDLWERRFKKAAKQLSGERGGILVFEWESIADPSIFMKQRLFQELAASTFREFPHVARIVMECDTPATREGGKVDFSVDAYSVTNDATTFPEVRRFLELDPPA